MDTCEWFHIKNWQRFQHYKTGDRNPPWIKLHVEMLSSRDWVMLSNDSRVLLIACMVVASKNGGKIPNDPDYIKRVAYLSKADFKPLISCGFLVPDSKRYQMIASAPIEEEEEEEKEKIYRSSNGNGYDSDSDFIKFWNAYPNKVGKRVAFKAFKKFKKEMPSIDELITAIEQQQQSDQWQDKRFIPNPATWINQGRWDDELPPPKPKLGGYDL